jgi:Putative zinc-finger
MDCEACNNLILDHLYGELDEVRSAAVRKHLDGCADCKAAFERLAGGRRVGRLLNPVEAPLPNAALHEAILAAAISNARPRAEGVSEAIVPVIPIGSVSRIPRWMSRVGEMAMRRQVAMAAVFLLMVGFGLGYHQFQSPTRPVQLSDEPSAEVIPATELPSAASQPASEGAALAHRNGRGGNTDTRNERHDQGSSRAAQPILPGRIAPAPPPAEHTQLAGSTPHGYNAQGMEPQLRAANTNGGLAESPAPYRTITPPEQNPPNGVALGQRLSGDPALDRGMPRLAAAGSAPNLTLEGQPVPTRAAPTQVAQAANSTSWQSLRDNGESLRARGQSDLAIVAFRDALAQDPPDAERRAIAQSLVDTLLQRGQVHEASVIQGRYLARPTELNGLSNEVHGDSSANAVTSRPAASRPMPSHAAPRSRRAPSQSDAYNNLAY